MTLLLLFTIFPFLLGSPLTGWKLQAPWEVVSQALLPSHLIHVPLLLKGNEEEFLLAQGKFGSEESGDAISPILPASSASRILTFKYAKVGAADLQILLKEEGESFRLLDSVTEISNGKWSDRTTVLPAGEGQQQLYFRARGILDGLDAVAISSIQIKPSPTSVLSVSKNIPKGIRRKPISRSKSIQFCEPIQCSFHHSSCQWSLHGFTPLDGKVVSKENGILTSEPILQPPNAHFQIEIFVSESATASVQQRVGSEEQLLWTAGGMILPGWNTVRLPLRFSPFPSKILIKASSIRGGYVAVKNTKLVDEIGNDLVCGLNLPAIRPKNDGTIRLTAVQKIDYEVQKNPIYPQMLKSPLFSPLFITSTTTERIPISAQNIPKAISSPANFMKLIDMNKLKAMAKQFGLDDKAITPINEPVVGYIPKKSEFPFSPANIPPALQKAFSEKLSQLIELPPSTSSRESRPFSRQSIDWVVQHAFNNFMNRNRP